MRIGFVSPEDPRSSATWSGTTFAMYQALVNYGHHVEVWGPLSKPGYQALRIAAAVSKNIPGHRYKPDREKYLSRSYGRQIQRAMARSPQGVDVIISPGAIQVAQLRGNTPTVIWADGTYELLRNYYREFTGWSKRSERSAEYLDRAAISKCALFIGSSEWATASAERHYSATATATVPFGSNAPAPLFAIDIDNKLNELTHGIIKLAIVGVDWHRKGVDIAIETVDVLRSRGFLASLHVVGCLPPPRVIVPSWVKLHGFALKDQYGYSQTIDEVLRDAHLFLLPSRAECFGVAVCEAASYSVPSVVRDTGGLPTVVQDGRTGRVIHSLASKDFANAVQELSDVACYRNVSESAKHLGDTRLNWKAAAAAATEAIERALGAG